MAVTPADPVAWGLAPGYAELVERRTRNSKTFRRSDGSYTSVFGSILHYQPVADGTWEDVVLEYRPTGNPGEYIADQFDLRVVVRQHLPGLQITDRNGDGIYWATTSPMEVDGRNVYFTDHGLRWQYGLTKSGVKLISEPVSASRGPYLYRWPYDVVGNAQALYGTADGGLTNGVLTIKRAVVLGANGERYDCEPWQIESGGWAHFWFDDSALPLEAFPYEIDPSTTFKVASGADDGHVIRSGPTWVPAGTPQVDTSGTTIWPFINKYGSTYHLRVALIRWDTSSLPDNAVIISAKLRVNVSTSFYTTDHRLTAEWYDSWPIDASDWTASCGNNAIDVPVKSIPSYTAGFLFELQNANSGVSRTAYTGLRFGISPTDTPPTTPVGPEFDSFENTKTDSEPTLIIEYTEGGDPTPQPETITASAIRVIQATATALSATMRQVLSATGQLPSLDDLIRVYARFRPWGTATPEIYYRWVSAQDGDAEIELSPRTDESGYASEVAFVRFDTTALVGTQVTGAALLAGVRTLANADGATLAVQWYDGDSWLPDTNTDHWMNHWTPPPHTYSGSFPLGEPTGTIASREIPITLDPAYLGARPEVWLRLTLETPGNAAPIGMNSVVVQNRPVLLVQYADVPEPTTISAGAVRVVRATAMVPGSAKRSAVVRAASHGATTRLSRASDTVQGALRRVARSTATVQAATRRTTTATATMAAAAIRQINALTGTLIQAATARLVISTVTRAAASRRSVRATAAVNGSTVRSVRATASALAATVRQVTALTGAFIQADLRRVVTAAGSVATSAAMRRVQVLASVAAAARRAIVSLIGNTIAADAQRRVQAQAATTGSAHRTTRATAAATGAARRMVRADATAEQAAAVRSVSAAGLSIMAATLRRILRGAPKQSGSLTVTVHVREATMRAEPRETGMEVRK